MKSIPKEQLIKILVLSLTIIVFVSLFSDIGSYADWINYLTISLDEADVTLVGEDNGDWTGYFASPAGDVNGDGLGDVLIGAPMAGDKICPYELNPDGSCPGLLKGQGVAYLVLGSTDPFPSEPINLADSDASFLGCFAPSMTARQLYTAGDVNGDGYDDMIISGWKCGFDYTGKAYLFLGREDVSSWGSHFPVESADASFLGENRWDFFSYYVSTAGDVNNDGFDDFLVTSTHNEQEEICSPGTPADCVTCCKNFVSSVEVSHLISDTWSITSSLNITRLNHTAVVLQNGKVLVAGGQNVDNYLSSSEIFDPSTGIWTLTGSLNISRTGQTMALMNDGMVLVAGGENENGFTNSAELYNPETGTWVSTGSLNITRTNHTMTMLPDGKALITGGLNEDGFLNDAELFDPDTGTWSMTTSLISGRAFHTATYSPSSGQVIVVGGANSTGTISSTELYSPTVESWTLGAIQVEPRSGHTATLLPNNHLLIVGGQNESGYLKTAEYLDQTNGLWIQTENLKTYRSDHTATLLQNGKVLIAGGWNFSGSQLSYEIYDPSLETWEGISFTINMPRANHTATLLPDGEVLIAGGRFCKDNGKVYLFLGRETADWGLDFDSAMADASFIGEGVDDRLGRSATGVGDVNNDGYDDILIGAISSDYGGENAGQNYLFLGRATEGSPDYNPSYPWWGNNFSVSGADASFVGEAVGDETGRRVAAAGDINGDGYDDMLMQAARNDYAKRDAGISYLVLGRLAADWGLRYPLANADASFTGIVINEQAGRRLSGAGDVNNDGYADIIIGAPHNEVANNEQSEVSAGAAYLIFGRAAADWGSYYSLSQADITYFGKPEIGVAGYDIAWLGDFNGDSMDDFLIAAYGGRNSDHVPGEVYISFGRETPRPVQFLASSNKAQQNLPVIMTGEYWEPNGMEDLDLMELQLDHPNYGVRVRYRQSTNEMHLWDSVNLGWIGPCTPEDLTVLQSDIVRLECSGSRITPGLTHNLRVSWRLRWKVNIEMQSFDVNLRAVDYAPNDSQFINFGSWPIYSMVYLPTILR